MAAGLADAHAAGLIHRDIKPANVLLRRRGNAMSAYLGDFGIARQLDAEATHASQTGTVGTPSYMAPELHTGGTAGRRQRRLLAGLPALGDAQRPGALPAARRSTRSSAPTSSSRSRSCRAGRRCVTEVNRILRTAMAKDPADRYASAARLRDDLHRARSLPVVGGPRTGRVAAAGGHHRGLVAGLVVLGVLLVVLAIG